MKIEHEIELRRQLEEPLTCECRNYPLDADSVLITMLDTPYSPPYMPDALHCHNCLEIGLCMAGHGKVRLCEHAHPFSPGSLIFVPRNVYHSQQNMGEPLTHWRYLVINEEALLRSTPERYREPIVRLLESTEKTGLFFENLRAESGVDVLFGQMFGVRRANAGANVRDLELCAMLLLTFIARQASTFSFSEHMHPAETHLRQPIEPALTYVYEHYKEDIHISQMAKSCSMSESYFRKLFQRIMGQTPLEYVNRYRIHRSMNLLLTTSDSIQSIAFRTGFSSIAAYNRNFKRHVGQSPTAWRQEHPSRA